MKELELHDAALVERPTILVLNKIDLPRGAEAALSFIQKLSKFPGIFITYSSIQIYNPFLYISWSLLSFLPGISG